MATTNNTHDILNKLIDDIADAFEEYAMSLEDDANFWEAINSLRQYIKTLPIE